MAEALPNNSETISYNELSISTDNWSDEFVLDRGGFGTVYVGMWNQQKVAIKKIRGTKYNTNDVLNEINYMTLSRHERIINFMGYCKEQDDFFIVLELMRGGSLHSRLHHKDLPPLTWKQRRHIVMNISAALNYLHNSFSHSLIHGDIKPENILLDEHMNAKIGDFGLSRVGPYDRECAILVSEPFGTTAYMAPELKYQRILGTKADTYSFGLTLLEVFTGLPIKDKYRADVLLADYVKRWIKCTYFKWEYLVDHRIPLPESERDLVIMYMTEGINCINEDPQYRPQMEQVCWNLSKVNVTVCT